MASMQTSGIKTPDEPKLTNEMQLRFERESIVREDKGDKELTLLKFSKGNKISLSLKLVSSMNAKTHEYGPIRIRQTFSIGGKFVDFLTEADDIEEFADFLKEYANAVKGVPLTSSVIRNDTKLAKEFLAGFKTE